MFCPKCSHKQISVEIRYCSKCGFALKDVSEALANEGRISREVRHEDKHLRKNVIKGVAAMTLGGIFFILSLIIGTPEPSLFVQFNLLVGILAYIGGIGFIAYHFLFKGDRPETGSKAEISEYQKVQRELHAGVPTPAAGFTSTQSARSPKAEHQHDSVTDQTTRKLHIDDNGPLKG